MLSVRSKFVWAAYLVLLVLSVPWYWPRWSAEILVLGFPLWAATSLACYFVAAVLTVVAIDSLWREQAGRDEAAKRG